MIISTIIFEKLINGNVNKKKEIRHSLEIEFEEITGVSIEYLPFDKLTKVIYVLKSGEADTLKEALSVVRKEEHFDFQEEAIRRAEDAAFNAEQAAERAIDEINKLKK